MNILLFIHNKKQVEHVLPVMEYLRGKANPIAVFSSQSMEEPTAGYIISDDHDIGPPFAKAGFPYREIPKYSFPELREMLYEFDIQRILLIQANTRPSCYVYRDIKKENLPISIVSQQCSIVSPEDLSWYGKTWCGDVVAAHSEYAKSEMVGRRGVDPSIIHVTGSPKFDALARMETESDDTILFIGQNNHNVGNHGPIVSTQVTDLLCSLLLELPENYKVLIKEHPNIFFDSSFESSLEESLMKSKFAHLRERISRLLVADTMELIRKASLVSTIYSNCGLEAMVMNKPTVILNIHPHARTLYGDSGAITGGDHDFVSKCLSALQGECDKEARRRFVNKMLLIDGKASERIGELIMKTHPVVQEKRASRSPAPSGAGRAKDSAQRWQPSIIHPAPAYPIGGFSPSTIIKFFLNIPLKIFGRRQAAFNIQVREALEIVGIRLAELSDRLARIEQTEKQGEIVSRVRSDALETYLRLHHVRKLHLGAGTNVLSGWFNTDIAPKNEETFFLDARKQFPFENDTFDYIFCEHLIEHLKYGEGLDMLKECRRVLRSGGKIRIATPDIEKVISLYDSERDEVRERYIKWNVDTFLPDMARLGLYRPCFVVNNFFRDWGHQFIYDATTLQEAMEHAGFADISTFLSGESDDRNIQGVEQHGRIIGEELNRFETMVLQGNRP